MKVQELPFRLLATLLEHAGEIVPREELQAKLWAQGTYVDFERGLGTALNKVREALGDSASSPRFIETIPRRGYRFIAPVERTGTPPETPAPRPPQLRAYGLACSALALILTVAGWSWWHARQRPLTDLDVLVLADFSNLTGDRNLDGTIREAVAFDIEQSPFLKVLDDEAMRQDMQLMGRSAQEPVTHELARAICIREAEKAMFGGSIARMGSSYVIELQATNCQTGLTLARQLADAGDQDNILKALAKAVEAIRAKLGESLASIQKLAPPEF